MSFALPLAVAGLLPELIEGISSRSRNFDLDVFRLENTPNVGLISSPFRRHLIVVDSFPNASKKSEGEFPSIKGNLNASYLKSVA